MTTSPTELTSLILALLVLAYALYHFRILSQPRYSMFFLGLYCVVAGLVATVLESFAIPEVLNIIEHTAFALGAILLAIGCRRFVTDDGEE